MARRSSKAVARSGIAAAALIASVTVAGCAGSASGGKGTINIGTIADLSGPASVIGIAGQNGQKLAVSLVNAQAGKYLGNDDRSLKLTYDDATNSVTTAVTQARTFISHHNTVAIIGPTYQNQALSIGGILSSAKIPLLVPYSQGTKTVTDSGPYVFNSSQTNDGTIAATMTALHTHFGQDKKIGIITESDSSTQVPAVAKLAQLLPKQGLSYKKCSLPTASTDLASCIATMKSFGAQTIWIWNTAPADVAAMQQAERTNYHPHWVGFSNMFDPSVISGGGAQAEGALMTADYNPDLGTPLVKTFQTKYKARFGKAPNSWAALGFQSVLTMAAAIKSIKGDVTGSALRDALIKVKATSVTGHGTFEFDHDTRLEASPPATLTIKSGAFVDAS